MAVELGLESTQPSDVFRAAQGGDARACLIAETVGAHLGRAVRALILTFGVDRVVVGDQDADRFAHAITWQDDTLTR